MSASNILVMRFEAAGDFAALGAAEAWCRAHSVSFGSMERAKPIGLIVGPRQVSKWTRMSMLARKALHGTITGDMRQGPVVLRIDINALRAAGVDVRAHGTATNADQAVTA